MAWRASSFAPQRTRPAAALSRGINCCSADWALGGPQSSAPSGLPILVSCLGRFARAVSIRTRLHPSASRSHPATMKARSGSSTWHVGRAWASDCRCVVSRVLTTFVGKPPTRTFPPSIHGRGPWKDCVERCNSEVFATRFMPFDPVMPEKRIASSCQVRGHSAIA